MCVSRGIGVVGHSKIIQIKFSSVSMKIRIRFHESVSSKGRLFYHLFVKCFSQLSFDSEVYTKSATAADFVHTSESNESCEKHSTQR